jgi:flagellar hook assembly protein FlgD
VEDPEHTAGGFRLHPPTPNPSRGSVALTYEIPAPAARVLLKIHNLKGEVVRTLSHVPGVVGENVAAWDGRDDRGKPVACGVYFCVGTAGTESVSRKLVILR